MKTIVYRLARKQQKGDGYYVDFKPKDLQMINSHFSSIWEAVCMTPQYPRELQQRFLNYLEQQATVGDRGKQTRYDVIEGIIDQKVRRHNDYSTRQLAVVQSIYNDFAAIFEVEPIEFVSEDEYVPEAAANFDRFIKTHK